jgi:hypothetical protein
MALERQRRLAGHVRADKSPVTGRSGTHTHTPLRPPKDKNRDSPLHKATHPHPAPAGVRHFEPGKYGCARHSPGEGGGLGVRAHPPGEPCPGLQPRWRLHPEQSSFRALMTLLWPHTTLTDAKDREEANTQAHYQYEILPQEWAATINDARAAGHLPPCGAGRPTTSAAAKCEMTSRCLSVSRS